MSRRDRLKRTFDLSMVFLTSPIWLPLIAGIAIIVRIKLGTPVFFRQPRPGLNAKVFPLVKFRTMSNARDSRGQLLSDAERLKGFGRALRASSLDELPEIWNVICGEMSLVGPRPLLVRYLGRYNARQAKRHEVRPGITGLAQVKGRNALSWDERFEWDVRYVETYSFGLDLKILWMTIRTVLLREGISSKSEATMAEFDPSKNKSLT